MPSNYNDARVIIIVITSQIIKRFCPTRNTDEADHTPSPSPPSPCNTTVKGGTQVARREERNDRAGWTRRAYYASELPCRASRSMPRCTTTLADTPLRESSQAGNLITDNFAPRRTWGLLYLDSRMSRSREGELTPGTVPVNLAIRRDQRFESDSIFRWLWWEDIRIINWRFDIPKIWWTFWRKILSLGES